MLRSLVARLGRAVRVVIHDPEVGRAGRGFAVLIAIRLALALGASAQMIEFVRALLGA